VGNDFDPHRPIYLQIVEEVKRRVARGDYAPGQQLPSVRELAQDLGVNPNTLARAYLELEREGFVVSRRGQGSFVTTEPGRVADERRRLAEAAADRFAAEISGLALGITHFEALVNRIRKAVR
jgi:GntR family transcriptional regulator